MGQGYLIDTNAAIDYLDNKLPEKTAALIDDMVCQVSVITRMELLGWPNATDLQLDLLEQFIKASVVFNLDEPVIIKAIDLRRNFRVKLPDAIIAATALVYDLTLITRNTADFKSISGLTLIDPHMF